MDCFPLLPMAFSFESPIANARSGVLWLVPAPRLCRYAMACRLWLSLCESQRLCVLRSLKKCGVYVLGEAYGCCLLEIALLVDESLIWQ